MASRKCVAAVLLFVLVLCIVIIDDTQLVSFSSFLSAERELDLFDTCPLRVYDPFYKDVAMNFRHLHPTANCQTSAALTKLEHGRLRVVDGANVSSCRARCLYYATVTQNRLGPWRNVTAEHELAFDCDFVHSECFDESGHNIEHFVHMQIVRQGEKPQHAARAGPDVLMFVLDSVSSTQARRSLPRTLSFLETKLGGLHFHHLNKVGDNSRPNTMAMFLGWRIDEVRRSFVDADNLEPQHYSGEYCENYLDNKPVIHRMYEKAGYKTFYADDYVQGTAFTYYTCKGFSRQDATHVHRPMIMALADAELRKGQDAVECYESFKSQLAYLGQFLETYQDESKFAVVWQSELAHDDANLLPHSDDHFFNFLQKYESYLQNAFVVFMGDHGPRLGYLAATRLSFREIFNPLLHLSIPRFLRSHSQLAHNLRENALRLVTQYDVHATLTDILEVAPQSNFTDFSYAEVVNRTTNNATSLLRPFPPILRSRNCKNVPIDAAYCLCEYSKQPVQDEELTKATEKFAASQLNLIVQRANLSHLCCEFAVEKTLYFVEYAGKADYFEYGFRVTPGGGEFSMKFRLRPNTAFSDNDGIARTNAYSGHSECIAQTHEPLKPFCFCRSLLR